MRECRTYGTKDHYDPGIPKNERVAWEYKKYIEGLTRSNNLKLSNDLRCTIKAGFNMPIEVNTEKVLEKYHMQMMNYKIEVDPITGKEHIVSKTRDNNDDMWSATLLGVYYGDVFFQKEQYQYIRTAHNLLRSTR